MKKTFILLALIGCFATMKAQTIKVVYPGYTSFYNVKTLIPDSVLWVITPHKKAADRATRFFSTDGRSNLNIDYAGSKHDIGHNCPASDQNGNKQDETNSFDFVNAFPQVPNLNRITWEHLESYCRDLAVKYGACRVKTSWVGIDTQIGKHGVTVPLYCIKQIWYADSMKIYKMPNRDTVIRHNFQYYRIK